MLKLFSQLSSGKQSLRRVREDTTSVCTEITINTTAKVVVI